MSCCNSSDKTESLSSVVIFILGLVVGMSLATIVLKSQNEKRLINISEHVGATVHRYQELQNVYGIQDAAIPAIAAHKVIAE